MTTLAWIERVADGDLAVVFEEANPFSEPKGMSALKMFVWGEVLRDYSAGIAVAVAGSREEAKAVLLARGFPDHAAHELDDEAPAELELPNAAWCYGGS